MSRTGGVEDSPGMRDLAGLAVMLVGKTDFGMRVKNSVHGEDKTGTHSQTVY